MRYLKDCFLSKREKKMLGILSAILKKKVTTIGKRIGWLRWLRPFVQDLALKPQWQRIWRCTLLHLNAGSPAPPVEPEVHSQPWRRAKCACRLCFKRHAGKPPLAQHCLGDCWLHLMNPLICLLQNHSYDSYIHCIYSVFLMKSVSRAPAE